VLHTEVMGDVLLLTIDRPERRNALDHTTLDALAAALVTDDPRVVVLTGAAGHFCAGADLAGVEDPAFVARLQDVLERLIAGPFVTLAAIDGAALGAGTQLAVACDLRLATPTASFGIPAARLGLAVDSWTVDRVALLAGHSTAQAMLLAAEVIDGTAAHRTGLVQRLGTLDDALGWAKEITALAPLTIRAHKTALRGDAVAAKAARDRAWASQDLQEGLAAFRDRRPPEFRGA